MSTDSICFSKEESPNRESSSSLSQLPLGRWRDLGPGEGKVPASGPTAGLSHYIQVSSTFCCHLGLKESRAWCLENVLERKKKKWFATLP